MKRLLLEELLNWKDAEKRKPILLDGARQVGKSYLLKELFGKAYFDNVHTIDFLKSPDASLLFEDDLEPERIIDGISLFLNKRVNPEKDLIIFDEIGECPRAVQSLKFIAEDKPQWFVCSSGSNIGLLDSFPVGKVHGLTLRPMNIEEFIMALGSELEYSMFQKMDRTKLVHNQLWSKLVDYFFVGGMPESVQSWLDTKEKSTAERRRKVRQIQKDILQGYERDFGKYSGKMNALHISQVFKSVIDQIQKNIEGNVKRFTFKGIIEKKSSYRDFSNIIEWLEKTHLISKCFVINKRPIVPLRAIRKNSFFKLFYLDVGLLSCSLGINESALNMGDMLFKGVIAENFIQNELLSYGYDESYSWSENTAEIEFLLEKGNSVIPVEVKAGKNTKAKSLSSFKERYAPENTIKLIGAVGGTDPKDIVLPLYYSNFLNQVRLID